MNTIDHKVCVAPMMQYTDMHDRYLLRLISKKVFLYTEMIATGSLVYGKCFDQLMHACSSDCNSSLTDDEASASSQP